MGVSPKRDAQGAAVAPNNFQTRGLANLGSSWIKVTNDTKELHFFDVSSVKEDTTEAMVSEALQSDEEPPFITEISRYFLDVVSPGISVVWRGPFKADKYLVTCWMPRESDGTPHALMGMWQLTTIG